MVVQNYDNFWLKVTRLRKKYDVFWNGGMPRWKKLRTFLQNKGVQNLKLSKNVKSKSDLENPNLAIFVTLSFPFQMIYKFPLNLVTFKQKPSYLCVHKIDTPHSKSWYSLLSESFYCNKMQYSFFPVINRMQICRKCHFNT